jgi:phosphoribosylamine--glycine ligase
VVSDGGRVLSVTALGETIAAAQARAYQAVQRIEFPNSFYRHDIANKAIQG